MSFAMAAQAAEAPAGLDLKGNPGLKSAGALAFGPEGVLLVADPQGAAIYAIATGESPSKGPRSAIQVGKVDLKIASRLGTAPDQILINDLAVSPSTGVAYLSVSRGKGPDAIPVIVKVDYNGDVTELALDDVAYGKAELPNAPDANAKDQRGNSQRQESITDLAYLDGKVLVAGLSNEEFASKLRSIPFPFDKADAGTSVEIYHGAHGAFETRSPVRTFAAFNIKNEPHLLAAYTCTPLVKFPLSQLEPGKKVKGVTVAELGNRNRPLDMVVYKKDGKNFLLLANSARGVMKISTEDLERETGIEERIADKAGQKYETIASLKGVEQLDRLDDSHALLLARNDEGLNLQTIDLP